MIDLHTTTIQEWINTCKENIEERGGCVLCKFKMFCMANNISRDIRGADAYPCSWWEV